MSVVAFVMGLGLLILLALGIGWSTVSRDVQFLGAYILLAAAFISGAIERDRKADR